MKDSAYFDVYGYRFVVRGSAELIDAMEREFAHFPGTEASGAVEIIGKLEAPRYDDLPALDAAVHSARNISYSHGEASYIDYHGRALAHYDTVSGRFEVAMDLPPILRQAVKTHNPRNGELSHGPFT